jgi:ankyrin repeat protein
MQPLQYDLQCPAVKDNSNYSITHAAAAPSNLDAAITMRAAKTKLQSTVELRATASEIAAPKPDGSRRQREKITI